MTFPRYPKYKDSRIKWLGELPEDWSICALNYRYEVELGKMLDEKRITGNHLAPYLRNVDVQWNRINTMDLPEMDFTGEDLVRYRLKEGDLLICEGGEIGRAAIWHAPIEECYYQKALHRVRSRESGKDNARFLSYVLFAAVCADVFTSSAGRSTIAHLPAETLRRYRFPFPPLVEQLYVADFLDRETAKIDTLIAEQERLIELLKEKRQAVISHAVTKGLNPDAPMKPTGIEWLGDVPAHWRVTAIKWLSAVQRGASPRPIDDPKYFDEEGEYAWVRISDVSASDGVLKETTQRLSKQGEVLSVKIEPGQLFVSIAGSVGKPCVSAIKACIHDGFVYFPKLTIDPRFLYRVFEAGTCYGGLGKLGTQLNLNTDTIGSICVVVPSAEEISQILDWLDNQLGTLDALCGQIEKAISTLQERRTALISAAVTGQIDVRELARKQEAA